MTKLEDLREKAELEERTDRTLLLKLGVFEAKGSANNRYVAGGGEGPSGATASQCLSSHNLMPSFDDQRDDIDAYLERFEVLAMGQ